MSDWLPSTDDVTLDGAVEVCEVRDPRGRDGVRVRLVGSDPGELESFDAFYSDLVGCRGVHVLERDQGWVVFESADESPGDLKRFAMEAVERIEGCREVLRGLSADEIGCREGRVRLLPRWRQDAGTPPLRGLGDYLRRTERAGELDEALETLTTAAPEARRAARTRLLDAAAEEPEKTEVHGVKVTAVAATASRGRVDTAEPRAAVVLTAERLGTLTAAQRSAAAGLAGLPIQALAGLQAGGLPLVLETHRRPGVAVRRATRLAEETGLPLEAATGGGVMRLLVASTLLMSAAASGMGAATFALVGLVTLPLLGALLTLAMLALGVWMGLGWNAERVLLRHAVEAFREAEEERNRQGREPELARAWSALADARAALAATSELPAPAAADLRDVLRAAEAELQELAQNAEVVRRGLAGGDPEEVRARLLEVPPGADGDRRRESLRRTLVELEDLVRRRERIAEEGQALEAVLSEMTGAVARWETTSGEAAMQAVARATQAAKNRKVRRHV